MPGPSHTLPPTYPGLHALPATDVHRIQAYVLRSDSALILSITGVPTTLSHIVTDAVRSTAEFIRQHNLTYGDSEELYNYLRKRSAHGVTHAEADAPHVPGRDSGRGEQVAQSAGELTVAGKGTPRRRSTGKRKAAGGEKTDNK